MGERIGRTGTREYVGQDKDREVTLQLSLWAKQTQFGQIYCQLIQMCEYWLSIEKQALQPPNICMLRENTFPSPFPGLTSLPAPLCPPLLSPQIALCPFREAVRRGWLCLGCSSFSLILFSHSILVWVLHKLQFLQQCLFLCESSMGYRDYLLCYGEPPTLLALVFPLCLTVLLPPTPSLFGWQFLPLSMIKQRLHKLQWEAWLWLAVEPLQVWLE